MGSQLRGRALVASILVTSGFDFTLFGYDQGVFGGILAGQRFLDILGNPNSTMTGLVTAIYDIGCAFGALAAFIWGEKLGRRKSIIVANVIVIVGAVIQTASYEYWQMFVSRIITGVGVGLSTVAVPILQSETLPAHNRGSLLVVQGALVVFGSAVASWLCFATLHADSSLQWRFPVACQVLLSALTLGSALFAPESPRWLAKHQREDEARNVTSRILDVPEFSPEVDGQLTEIIEAIAAESLEEPSWREVFTNSTRTRNLQRTVLGMAPYLMNQWSGINTVSHVLSFANNCCFRGQILINTLLGQLLPSIHLQRISWLFRINGSDPRIGMLYTIQSLLLARLLLHRPNRPSLDPHSFRIRLLSLHGSHRRLSPQKRAQHGCRCRNIHVPLL